jgi:hypothetical protein
MSVAEHVYGLSFMQPGETHVIVRTINSDVISLGLFKGGHQFLEVVLAAHFAQVGGGEIGVHAGAIPVGVSERFAMILYVDAIFFRQALQDVAGDPHFVSGFLGAFTEDLELPLAFGNFGVDALMIDARIETDVEVLLDNPARATSPTFL